MSDLNHFFSVALQSGLGKSARRLALHTSFFEGIDFRGKRVLDIGCGTGSLALFAAYQGAKEVIALEPEHDGSRPGMVNAFQRAQQAFGLTNVQVIPKKIQEYQNVPDSFDIIVLKSAINHLDEDACERLLHDAEAVERYVKLFSPIGSLLAPGGVLLVGDCSRYNLWPACGLPNPFARSIEWEKHQAPETWANVLEKAGFEHVSTDWLTPLYGFGAKTRIGRWFQKTLAYCVYGHFRIILEKTRGLT